MELIDRLPKGERDNAQSCPCGLATGVYVDNLTWGPDEAHNRAYELPIPVQEFVSAFDAGELPQYDANPWVPEGDD